MIADIAAYKSANPSGRQVWRMKQKNLKLERVPNLSDLLKHPIKQHEIDCTFKKTKRVFWSGTSEREIPNAPKEDIVKSAVRDLQPLSPTAGVMSRNHFILVPRTAVMKAHGTNASWTRVLFDMFRSVDNTKNGKTLRGHNAVAIGSYVCYGTMINRNQPGYHSNLRGLDDRENKTKRRVLDKFIRTTELLLRDWMDTKSLLQLKYIREASGHKGIEMGNGKASVVFGSIAFGLNTYLATHVDRDYFYCCVRVISRDDVCFDSEVLAYFTFPGLGASIGLKNGDSIIFNPNTMHCVSSRCNRKKDIYCVSFYLKTAHVTGNKNDQNIDQLKKERDVAVQYYKLAKGNVVAVATKY